MNEIEKLYENAGVEKFTFRGVKNPQVLYPPFTAEKQLEIVKCILFSTWWMNLKRLQFAENFKEALAGLINDLWQSITEEAKEQIKGILE